MSKAYSEDFRECVIMNHKKGMLKDKIVTTFNIGIDTLNRWIRQYRETGSLAPKIRTVYRKRKFSDDDLLNFIKRNPSATLEEIGGEFSVKPSSVHARLKAIGVTRKKNITYMKKETNKKEPNF